jgi:cysteine desulfuration protein SufE
VATALAALAADMKAMDRAERSEMLIAYADQFVEVPPAVATRPFDERHRAPRCESDAFVFATDNPDGTLKLHFAVENPQGISARAWAAILDESLSGRPLEEVASVDPDWMLDIFGRDLSMGKGQGLIGMLELVKFEASRRLKARAGS